MHRAVAAIARRRALLAGLLAAFALVGPLRGFAQGSPTVAYMPVAIMGGDPYATTVPQPPYTAGPSPTPDATRTPPLTPVARPTPSTEPKPPTNIYGGCVVFTESRVLYDPDGDSTSTMTYTAASRPLDSVTRYAPGSRYRSYRDDWTYDERGSLTKLTRDENLDGTTDITEYYTYDEWGRITSRQCERDGNGVADLTIWYEHNDYGDLLRELEDVDGNGGVDRVSTFTYDSAGNQVREKNADGLAGFNYSLKHFIWGHSRLEVETWDVDADGILESPALYYLYDDRGRLVRTEERNPANWSLGRWTTYTYGTYGYVTSTSTYAYEPESILVFRYDDHGRLVEERDDIVGYWSTRTYRCPASPTAGRDRAAASEGDPPVRAAAVVTGPR